MINKKFCFFGHVDCGKSTIAGHLYYKCGGLSEHETTKLENENSTKKFNKWSKVLDIYEEEQIKSKTHEFNVLELKFNNNTYNLIDTPGHKMFIRSLIEGISYFDNNEIIGCLVISASKGEFESGWNGGQTKEDIIIARSIGIRNMVILLNKMDTIEWSKDIYDMIIQKIKPFINNCNFDSVNYIPISGYDGIGLVNKEGLPLWYEGNYLMESLEKVQIIPVNVESIESEKWNQMICEVKILASQSIITAGFLCMLHYDGNEYEVTFEKIKDKKFLKSGESDTIIIKSMITINKGKNTRRIILRKDNSTIGFGKILKVK